MFFDPKSSESFTPYFSRGWRDDAIQRAYLEATFLFWSDPANNPASTIYSAPMVHVPECAAWTWDARPYPFFPELTDVWTDGPNWRLGHWLTGRLGAVSLAALVRHLCLRAGMPENRIDVSGLWGVVEGYVISALEAPRASISTLARHFGFDAVESEGCIRFLMRGSVATATITPDSMVAPASAKGDVMELTRAQEASFVIVAGGVLTHYIAAAPNGASAWVRLVNEVTGAVFEQEITVDLPATSQFLSPRLYMNNGVTAAAVAYDRSGVYVETDY